MDTIGKVVRARRRALDLSQDQVAQRSGMTREWVSALERDVMKSPGREALEQLEMAMDVPRGTFLAVAGYRTTPLAPRPRRLSEQIREVLRRVEEWEESHERESVANGVMTLPDDPHSGRRTSRVASAIGAVLA